MARPTVASPPPHPAPARFGASPPLAASASLMDNRLVHAAMSVAYLLFFWLVYEHYLSVVWGYAGLYFRPLQAWESAVAIVGVALVGALMPTRLKRPSALILWLLFVFVYVPTMAETFMLGERPSIAYLPALGALTIAMGAAGVLTETRTPDRPTAEFMPGQTFIYGFAIANVVVGLLLVVYYRSILTFADFTSSADVYASRFAASDMTSGIIAYVRLYFSYVIGPAVLAISLISRRHLPLLPTGLACFVITYMIDASKISLVIPLAMLSVYAVMRFARGSVVIMTGGLTILTMAASLLTGYSSALRFLADLILLRSIAIPGQQFALYYDLFGARGYTWWSNVRGVSLVVPPPAAFAADPRWPALGQIVGEEYYGVASQNNSNANLFAGEGAAAAGTFGVLVIGVLLILYLRLLDRAALGWDRGFIFLVMVPVGLALTNIHLSTLLLSFGGAFWVLAFAYLRPPGAPPAHLFPRARK